MATRWLSATARWAAWLLGAVFEPRNNDRIFDQPDVDRPGGDKPRIVRQGVSLAARRVQPSIGPGDPVDPERVDGEFVRLELQTQKTLVVLDAQRRECLFG